VCEKERERQRKRERERERERERGREREKAGEKRARFRARVKQKEREYISVRACTGESGYDMEGTSERAERGKARARTHAVWVCERESVWV